MIDPTDLLHPSPAPHFKTFQIFLICCPKRPSFSTDWEYVSKMSTQHSHYETKRIQWYVNGTEKLKIVYMVKKCPNVYRTLFMFFTTAHCQTLSWVRFLGAFTKLRKAAISFGVSVCLSVRMEQLEFHRKDFNEMWYLRICRQSAEKVRVSLNFDKNNGHFTEGPMQINGSTSFSS